MLSRPGLHHGSLQTPRAAHHPDGGAVRPQLQACKGCKVRPWQGSTIGATSVADLFAKNPGSRSPIAGYHILAGAYPSAALTSGATLATVDVTRTPGQPDKPVTVRVAAPLKASALPRALCPATSSWMCRASDKQTLPHCCMAGSMPVHTMHVSNDVKAHLCCLEPTSIGRPPSCHLPALVGPQEAPLYG